MNADIADVIELLRPYNIFYNFKKIFETEKKLCAFLCEKHEKKHEIVRNAQKLCEKYLKLLYFV